MAGITEKVFRQMLKEVKNPKSNVSKKKLREKISKYMKVYGNKKGEYIRPERKKMLKARAKFLKGKK